MSGTTDLRVRIDEGVAHIAAPSSDWVGVEHVEFTVCDAAGACETQVVVMGRLDGTQTTLHRIGNAGFVIDSPTVNVAIDAFFSNRATHSMTRSMREGAAPFDVDLILVTQNDFFHVSPQVIATTLLAQPDAMLVAPVVDSNESL